MLSLVVVFNFFYNILLLYPSDESCSQEIIYISGVFLW